MMARRSSSMSPVRVEDPTEAPASSSFRTEGPAAERKAALVAYFASPSPEQHAMDAAWEEALALYGDEDSDAWVAALQDGTHPLCRVPMPARPT
jgi:hypothetical protein